MQGGVREYPELVLYGGCLGTRKVAIDIKTARRKSRSRITGFTLGSFGGYFLNPNKKMPGCILPYGEFTEHWVVGFIYDWNPGAPSLSLVSNIEVIVQEKWRIASRSTGTGTTTAIGSIKDIDRLREGRGEFSSEEEFEEFWRSRGRRLRRR